MTGNRTTNWGSTRRKAGAKMLGRVVSVGNLLRLLYSKGMGSWAIQARSNRVSSPSNIPISEVLELGVYPQRYISVRYIDDVAIARKVDFRLANIQIVRRSDSVVEFLSRSGDRILLTLVNAAELAELRAETEAKRLNVLHKKIRELVEICSRVMATPGG